MILRKLMITFTSITIVAFLVMGTLLYSFMGIYALSEKKDNLESIGEQIAESSGKMLSESAEHYTRWLTMSFDLIGRNSDCELIMADRTGKVLLRTYHKFPDDKIEEMPEVLVSAIRNGNNADMTGDLVGISKKALAVAIPVVYNGETVAGVYMITNLPDINKNIDTVLRAYILSFIAVLIIVLILTYFFSRKITEPIKKIKLAAEKFSSGQLDERVDIKTKGELSLLAESFNEMADSLSKTEIKRRAFISDISHELRTPMTTITGFIQGILDDTIPDDKKEVYLKIVLDETKRLSRLVNDLLEASRYDSKDVELNKTKFDINELIRVTLIGFESRFSEKGIMLNADFKNDKEYVFAEKDSIKRVLTNLIDNAIKFCYINGKIEVRTKREGNKVTVAVKNDGEGMSKETQKFIFERFYKSDKSRSQNKQGVGLGLSIVKSIINKHGEKITVSSEEGKYAEFSFMLESADI